MGFYGLEGKSQNTFVSSLAALETLRLENPELYEPFCQSPFVFARVALHYGPPIYQAAIDTPVAMCLGVPDKVKLVRWNPHYGGPLLTTFDNYHEARRANEKFLEITRRDTHKLRVILQPGDLYVWDNFRILHGREGVSETPRTGVGHTVPEQVVLHTYRAVKVDQLKPYIDTTWLVHMTSSELYDLLKFMKAHATDDSMPKDYVPPQDYVPLLGC